MKKTFYSFLLFLLLLSCEVDLDSIENRTPCERAENHIYKCVGYIPAFACNGKLAEEILNTECENIEKLWR